MHYRNSQIVITTKGFTLIELLVVIAIIGVLSSIVLSSLNSARSKGTDASIKSTLDSLRTQGILDYDTNGFYGSSGAAYYTTCIQGATFPNQTNEQKFIDPSTGKLKGPGVQAYCAGTVNDTQWLIAAPLQSVSGQAWCIDSVGQSKQSSVASLNNFGNMPYVCP